VANVIFQYPTDQLLNDAVTITPSSQDSAYPINNLYDKNPAKAFKLDATSGSIVIDFGSAKTVQFVAIIHHNLDVALSGVAIQGNSSNSWGAPAFSQTITIPAYELDGFPVNPFIDISGTSPSYQFWRLNFGTPNSVKIQLGQLWIGALKRSFSPNNFEWGYDEIVERMLIDLKTDYDVSTIYDLGAKIRSWSPTLMTTVPGVDQFQQLWDACHGRALPMIVVIDPTINDARMVRFSDPIRTITRTPGIQTIKFGWREVSRGLVF
jgi:hypothetical protein